MSLLLILVLLFGLFGVGGGGSEVSEVTVEAAPPGTVEAVSASEGYAHPEWLVDALQVRAMLTADATVKVVALTPAEEFAQGHIPGAVQIDWPALEIVETSDQAVATWRGAVEEQLTALGIARSDKVVVYDGGTFYAARLWWILDQLGHEEKAILNGGLPAWIRDGGELQTGAAETNPASEPYVGAPNEEGIATLAEVTRATDDPDTVLIDARTAEEYVAGHVPGAVNIVFTENAVAGDGPKVWKSAAELRAMYAAAGVTPEGHAIPYCTTGVRSAATYFTLRLLGYEEVSLFTGSWKEWSSHPELPVATGETP
jgi:thiosulfate/3-mercaptopyruvate sulfurtransferase